MNATRVLFDTPGPRSLRRIRLATIITAIVVAALIALAVRQFGVHGELDEAKWQPFGHWPYINFLLQGLLMTLKAAAVAAVIAIPYGAVLALLRLSKSRLPRWIATGLVELFRAVPLLLVMYVFLLAIPRTGYTFPVFWQLVLPIVLCSGAVFAEVFRAGILALNRGQSEAAQAIGLRYWQAMRLVILPQAIRLVVPTLVSQLVSLLKDTTLGYVVSYPELLNQGKTLGAFTHDYIQAYLVVAFVYIVINSLLSQLARVLDRRQRRRRVPGSAGQATDTADNGQSLLDVATETAL
jgi:glutamate transport system permease protein